MCRVAAKSSLCLNTGCAGHDSLGRWRGDFGTSVPVAISQSWREAISQIAWPPFIHDLRCEPEKPCCTQYATNMQIKSPIWRQSHVFFQKCKRCSHGASFALKIRRLIRKLTVCQFQISNLDKLGISYIRCMFFLGRYLIV